MPACCLFCRRHDPDLNTVIAENGTCYARLDNYPANPGHVEIVPMRHVESLFDLTDTEAADAWALLREVEARIRQELRGVDGWTVGVNDGPAAGQSVPHLHIHLIPRHNGDVPDPRGGIRRAAPNSSPDTWSSQP